MDTLDHNTGFSYPQIMDIWHHKDSIRGDDAVNGERAERAAPGSHDPYRWHAIAVTVIVAAMLPAVLGLIVLFERSAPPRPWATVAERLGVEPTDIWLGEATFRAACALCHGQDGRGVLRLGKPLRNSAFVQQHTDGELFSLISQGRLPSDPANTTGALMPARGARGLSDQRLRSVIAYLRAMQDPTQPTASVEEWIVATANASGGAQTGELLGSASGIGHDLFIASCSACHGQHAEGMEGLGKPLATSPFVGSKTDEELIAFVKSGRPIWDPANTTGVDMPSKGGNPALTDEQLTDIVRYIRSLHKQ